MNLYENGDFGTDLAAERHRADTSCEGVSFKRESHGIFTWERIRISSEAGEASIGRPRGVYNTLSMPMMDTLCEGQIEDAADEVARELCFIFDECGLYPDRLLVAGLGNEALTPDAIGPASASLVNATMHLKNLSFGMFSEAEYSEIAVIKPGVTHSSGIDAFDIIAGICDRIMPSAVIAIDALAARSTQRLGCTVQLSDTGIFPGSGIGNRRIPLNKKTLGVPVIAIGVPTVINSRVFIMGDDMPRDRDALLRAKHRERDTENMYVSPKEINDILGCAAKIISGGINQAFGIM